MIGRIATGLEAGGAGLARAVRDGAPGWVRAGLPLGVLGAALAGAWWLATTLAIAGVALPVLRRRAGRGPIPAHVPEPGEPGIEAALARAQDTGADAVCIVLRLTDPATGGPPADAVMADRTARLTRILRAGDHIERRDAADVVIVLGAGPAPDLEDLVQLAARLQSAATAPGTAARLNGDAATPDAGPDAARLSAVLGVCRGADLAPVGPVGTAAPARPRDILDAAQAALADAQADGGGTIRVYAPCVRARRSRHAALTQDALDALDKGGFEAWFQPQVCTDTGRISGFEALARWDHPRHGVVSPGDFLPVLEAAGLLERLGELMLVEALRAIAAWDRDGFDVPTVGVNLSAGDLRDPRLPQRIAWMLDRHDLSGDRLTIEVLESVVAEGGAAVTDSPVLRNVAALADMGCHIDLDDFGTGHASITSLHRLAVSRVKIDRSFVSGIDTDRDRQKMMMTILSMCDHLGLQTLAEGVETRAEHAMLAQLGCNHVQGFGIGRPMPYAACCTWLDARNAELDDAMRPIRRHP